MFNMINKESSAILQYVLVTGGAGYIGSQACKTLKNDGFIPVTFDNLNTGWQDAVKYGPFEKGDLLNKADIERVFKKYAPVATMHFAALSQVGESIKQPALYWENNVVGSLNLIQAAIEHKCMNFIFSSTCAVYGDQGNVILDEDSTQNPATSYGSSKKAIENMLFDFQKAYGLQFVIFRYFNVAGADPESEIGEYHFPETHLIPLILDVVNGNRKEIKVYGTDYDTPDGTCIRDYVHVCDLVDAHILGLKWLQNGNESKVFNLGTGKGFSVREVIDEVKSVTKTKISIKETERRDGDSTRLVASANRAISELKWSPNRSSLRQMITDAWRWHQIKSYSK